MIVSDNTEILTMDSVNKDIYITMASSLQFPLNEVVAWAIFGDSTFVEDNTLLYSNYADVNLDTDIINSEHLELMSNIEQDIKQCIEENSQNVDHSTMDSTNTGINIILDAFLPKKYNELIFLTTKKNSPFKGLPIWWAALVIAHREMGVFAFKNGSYYVAMQLNQFSRECQSQIMFKNIAFIKAYQKKLSARNKIGGNTRWGDIVEQQRRRYLEIDIQHSKELGKETTIKQAAEFILFNHNDFNMQYENIYKHLSKARKGIFTDKKK